MKPQLHTLSDAEDAVKKRLIAENKAQLPFLQTRLRYNSAEVIETDRWWYIPYGSIGCAGFIVNKDDLYVNYLGSAIPLEQCFWGHDHGLYCDIVDFSFAPSTSRSIAARILERFKHLRANSNGVAPTEPVWYRESEIQSALAEQFPNFFQHFVWFAIPELIKATETEGLKFTSRLSKIHIDRMSTF